MSPRGQQQSISLPNSKAITAKRLAAYYTGVFPADGYDTRAWRHVFVEIGHHMVGASKLAQRDWVKAKSLFGSTISIICPAILLAGGFDQQSASGCWPRLAFCFLEQIDQFRKLLMLRLSATRFDSIGNTMTGMVF